MGAWQETWLALPTFKSLKPAQQKARVSRTETSMPGLVGWPCSAQSCTMLSQLFSTNRASVSILYLYPSCFKRPGLCQPRGKNRKKDGENNPTHSHCSILKMPKQEFCSIEFRKRAFIRHEVKLWFLWPPDTLSLSLNMHQPRKLSKSVYSVGSRTRKMETACKGPGVDANNNSAQIVLEKLILKLGR